MPKDTYTITLTAQELQYILITLKGSQDDLTYNGFVYDFLNSLINKLDDIFYKEN